MARRVGSIRLARREFYILSIVLCGGICKLIIMALRGAAESQMKVGGGAMDRFRSLYFWALRRALLFTINMGRIAPPIFHFHFNQFSMKDEDKAG